MPLMQNSQRKINYIGKLAKIRGSFGEPSLPAGLPEGSTVRIVGFDSGHFDVLHKGRRYKISMACVENLHQLWN